MLDSPDSLSLLGEGQGEGSRIVATSLPPSPQPSPGGRGSHSEPYAYLDTNLLDRVLADVIRAASDALEVDPTISMPMSTSMNTASIRSRWLT